MSDKPTLLDYMQEIQDEYLEILTVLARNITKDNMYFYIDEIKNYWTKRAKKIEFIFDAIITKELNVSFFTCATMLDIDDIHFYSFLLYGEYHIFDDPLVTYLMVSDQFSPSYSDYMFKKAVALVNDNIRILKELKSIIWVIPVRLLYSWSINIDQLKIKSNECFLSMFTHIDTIDHYFELCKCVEDIERELNPKHKNEICLTNMETPENTFVEKFYLLKNDKELPFSEFKDDAHIFYFQMQSYILQALDVIFTSIAARMVPLIRFIPSFFNFQMILQNFIEDIEDAKIICAKSVVHHLLHKRFPSESFEGINIIRFLEINDTLILNRKISNEYLFVNGSIDFEYISDMINLIYKELCAVKS